MKKSDTIYDRWKAFGATILLTICATTMEWYCWNEIAPVYLVFLPKAFHHMPWGHIWCFNIVWRSIWSVARADYGTELK